MKQPVRLTLGTWLGIVFLAGVVFWISRDPVSFPDSRRFEAERTVLDSTDDEPEVQTPEQSGSELQLTANQEGVAVPDYRLEFTRRFMRASDVRHAQAVIDDIRATGDSALANDLELEVRGRCGFLEDFEPPYERTRWAHELIVKYCSNYLPRSDESAGIPVSLTNSLASSQLRSQLLELETGEFDQYFMEFLANTNTAQELRAAESIARDLQRSGAPLVFGMTRDRLVTAPEAEKILETAFELYGCVRFGGCESHDFRVLEYCVLTGNCERGWNLFDIHRYTLAPNIHEQIVNVLNNMLNAGKAAN